MIVLAALIIAFAILVLASEVEDGLDAMAEAIKGLKEEDED